MIFANMYTANHPTVTSINRSINCPAWTNTQSQSSLGKKSIKKYTTFVKIVLPGHSAVD